MQAIGVRGDPALSIKIGPDEEKVIIPAMNTQQILQAVKAEVSRLNKVIALLEIDTPTTHTTQAVIAPTTKRKPHKWTTAERKAMSIKQKARWAAKKKKA